MSDGKVCVILGAGASFDVRNEGSPVIQGGYRPPLANKLFDATNEKFWEVLERYPGARFLTQDLTAKLQRGIGLEDSLRHYANHQNDRMRELFKQIPPYLRDLLERCSRLYTSEPGCYNQLVIELLAEHSYEVLFLVLNYDDLLERALTGFDSQYSFENLPDYISRERPAKVVKWHGSINWFRTLGNNSETWENRVKATNVIEKPSDSEILVLKNATELVRDISHEGQRWYPILTAPLAGKGITDAVCPESHQTIAKEFLSSCERILVVGNSGLDADLLALLEDSLDTNIRLIHFVGKGLDDLDKAVTNFGNVVDVFQSNDLLTFFGDGFQRYMAITSLQEFANQQI